MANRLRAANGLTGGAMLVMAITLCAGCKTAGQAVRPADTVPPPTAMPEQPAPAVQPAAFQESPPPSPPPANLPPPAGVAESLPPAAVQEAETLNDLEAWASGNNPALRRMQQEAAAQWARAGYVDKLPDPTVGAMIFGDAMVMDPDRQLAQVQVMQMIPWIGRLRAEAQQATMEALAAETELGAERLRVIGELRAAWFKLYVLGKQIETTEADKAQLQSLVKTANAGIAGGTRQPGDVLLATLELSSLEEQLLSYRQQIAATAAEINRLAGRDARVPIDLPRSIDAELPEWDHDLLRQVAFEAQPELAAARLRTAATRWGIDVARLKRRPDVSLGAGWMVMDADPGVPGGNDAWTLNVTTTLPIWHRKYDALAAEASRKHLAAHASEDEVAQRIDALLLDLWAQAVASQKTVELYETTILPQARQTYEADLKSLVNNTVTFDRVVRNYRTLLNLELGYHRALGQLATTLARIRQAVGVDLLATPEATQP